MNSKNFFLLPALLWLSMTKAQKLGVQLQESPTYKMTTARVQNDYILPDDKGGFITISAKRSGFLANPLTFEAYIAHYDQNMNLVKQKTFRMNKGIVKANIKGAFVAKDNLYMLEMESNLRKKYYAFKKITGNIDQGKIASEEEFFRINFIYPKTEVNLFVNPESLFYQKMKYYSDINFFNPKIFFKFSKNNRFFTIIYRDKAAQPTIYHIKVFNRDFKPVYSKNLTNEVAANLFYINDILVDDTDGDVCLTAKIYKNDPLKKSRIMNNDNTKAFMVYHASSGNLSKYLIKPEKVIEKLYLKIQKNLTIFGFYRHNFLDLNNINGLFRLNLSKNLAMLQESYQDFDHQLVTFAQKKGIKKTKNHQMIVRQAILTKDNYLIINSEDLYVPLIMKKHNREEEVREIVGDLFSIKITPNGHIDWAKKIYKKQIVKPRLATHSFFNTYIHQQNYLLFTDTTLEKPASNQPFYLKGKELKNLNGVKISDTGNVQKAVLYEKKRTKFRFMPIEGVMIGPKTAIIPAKDHMFIKFFKLTFE